MSGGGGGGEKTEKPTPKKLKEARAEGRIARTQDLGAWAGMLAATALLPLVIRSAGGATQELMLRVGAVVEDPDPAKALELLGSGLLDAAWAVAPLCLGLLAIGLALMAAQGGVFPSTKALKPKLSRLSPLQGVKRILGPQAAWEAAKLTVKTVVLGLVLWSAVGTLLPSPIGAGTLPLSATLATTGAAAVELVRLAALAGLVMAAADYAMVRRRTGKQLRMSKHEIKQENKQSEGDPQLKGAIRSRQLAMSRNRMMADVAKADLIVVNPTHVAVALRYDPAKGAPRVVGKGAGAIAARLRAVAELYTAVARVLAFVMSLKARGSAVGTHRIPA